MNYRYVLFDLDGTLLDTSRGIIASLRETVKITGLLEIPQESMRNFIGPPLELGIKKFFNITDEEVRNAVSVFREIYTTHHMFDAKPYDGVLELMQLLSENGVKLAIATYKRHEYAIEIIRHFGLERFCVCCYGSDNDVRPTKDHIIKACLDEMNADAGSCVYIGDTEFDAESAASLGIDFIGVTFGFGFKPGEATSYKMASDVADIKNILTGANEL